MDGVAGLEPALASSKPADLTTCRHPCGDGRSGGTRTHDLLLPRQARFALRYAPKRVWPRPNMSRADRWLAQKESNLHLRGQNPASYRWTMRHQAPS